MKPRPRISLPEAARLAGNLASATIDLERWDEAERYNQEAQRLWLATPSGASVYHLLEQRADRQGPRPTRRMRHGCSRK